MREGDKRGIERRGRLHTAGGSMHVGRVHQATVLYCKCMFALDLSYIYQVLTIIAVPWQQQKSESEHFRELR